MNFCQNCNKTTKNAKYCSKSCAAQINNKLSPKRSVEGNCRTCGTSIPRRNKYCKECHPSNVKDVKLEDVIYSKQHKSSAFALVRARARAVAKRLNWLTCRNCGYDKHVEIAHIKPISSFSRDTLLSVINHVDNLIPLCPNCHWEFDQRSTS